MEDVIAPDNHEGTKATILKWLKSIGDAVLENEPLLELETDKVTVEIPSPVSGTLAEILKTPDQEVSAGELLARMDVSAPGPSRGTPAPSQSSMRVGANETTAGPVPSSDLKRALSPSVRRLLAEHSLVPDEIVGSGRNGRITAQDVTRHLGAKSDMAVASKSPPPASSVIKTPETSRQSSNPGTALAGDSVRVTHTSMRRRVAEHMTRSLSEAPHVTTLFEADLTRVLAHRARHAADFQSRGARLTLTAYFVAACARALTAIPEVNATFHPDALELHASVNIGVGTALGDKGLIVPVIHAVQSLSLLGVAARLNTLVEAARAGKLAPEEVRGGTFTISNHGVGGSLLAAPIVINQPQVAILGVGKVERRVCAVMVEGVESISVRSMCYVTLSIDHRALDAFQANAFLSLVVKTLEQWPLDEA